MAFWRRGSHGRVNNAPSREPNVHISLAQLRTALNALPMGVIVIDNDGTEWWRNRAAHSQLDAVSAGQDVRTSINKMALRALRGETETTQLTIDGPPQRTIEAKSISLINGGALVVLEDITERFITDKVRTDFVANISHELKTPVGALSVLAETIVGETEHEQSEVAPLAKRMVAESHRVARIIDDLLELASIEFRGSWRQNELNVVSLVNESVARVHHSADERAIKIVKELPIEELVVVGDNRQIVSAISNLIENAVKYSENGKTITVEVALVGPMVNVSITDEGIGIAAEHLDRIFERFYRVDQARSRETGGTGLGLAIVRHVATNHGGEVNIRSTEGEGTTFVLSLPGFQR